MKLLDNLELKFISVIIATVLWIMVTGKDYRYADFNVPVEFKGLPSNLILTSTGAQDREGKAVTVRIRASETLVRSLNNSSMFVSVDISQLHEGRHAIQLTGGMVQGRPPGAEITDIFPRVLELDIEEKLIRPYVVVNPEILGKPADNYDIYQINCTPPSVSVRGPKSIVEKIDKISTSSINVDGLTTTTLERSLRLVPPHTLVTIFPEDVTLRIQIGEKIVSQSFKDVQVEVRNGEYETRVNPRVLVVFVQGPISQMEKLSEKNIRIFIQLTREEPKLKNIRLDPQFECVPADSFPDVRLERFSQNYVNIFVNNRKIQR